MAANLAKQGKMKEAYDTMLKYAAAHEKVFGEESSRRIAQMDVALLLKEKEDAILSLQLSEQNKTLQLRNIQIIVTALVMASSRSWRCLTCSLPAESKPSRFLKFHSL